MLELVRARTGEEGDLGEREADNKPPPVFVPPPPPTSPPPSDLDSSGRSGGFERWIDDSFDPVPGTQSSKVPPEEVKASKYESTGSLRDIYKKSKSLSRPSVDSISFTARAEDSPSNSKRPSTDAPQEKEQDYIQMSNDLIQDFFRKSKGREQTSHQVQPPQQTTSDNNSLPPTQRTLVNHRDKTDHTGSPPIEASAVRSVSEEKREPVEHVSALEQSLQRGRDGSNTGLVVAQLDKRNKSLGEE